ncbi:MAG: aminoacyl-tRNA hydrolase [Bacteroidia bacterium]|nr:aminoacyl-tRNA hydrolase [Bacteroidia bacterium]MDW8333095.1 aminoacyl-tRNA hydrolase [Bacteroidia bacterium]
MKFVVVGLGNPGPEYRATRHNIGFLVLERALALMGDENAAFQSARYAETALVRHRGKKILLVKPQTYMNLSGKAVAYYVKEMEIELSSLLVVTDDLALRFGAVRLRKQGSDGGHNGLADIQNTLGTTAYPRMRVGIGNDFPKGRQAEYVLSPFTEEERLALPEILDHCAHAVQAFVLEPFDRVASRFNRK